MWFFAIIFIGAAVAIILSIIATKSKNSESDNFSNHSHLYYRNNISQKLNDEEKKVLQEVRGFRHKENITQEDTHQYIINKINKTFLSIPGWEIWDLSVHQKEGQFERLQRGIKIDESKILAYDSNYEIAKILASNSSYGIAKTLSEDSIHNIGQVPENLMPIAYLTSAQHCSCPDFRERQLPCKHMYSLAIFLEEHGTESFCDENIKPLLGFNIALAGKFGSGSNIREQIEELGGTCSDNITFKTSMLVCGNNPSQRKIELAQERKMDILGKDDVLSIFSVDCLN